MKRPNNHQHTKGDSQPMKKPPVSKRLTTPLIYKDIACLGSWVLPSGTIVEARLLSAGTDQDMLDWEVKKCAPLVVDDLKVFADFVKPEAQQRALEFRWKLDHATRPTASANKEDR